MIIYIFTNLEISTVVKKKNRISLEELCMKQLLTFLKYFFIYLVLSVNDLLDKLEDWIYTKVFYFSIFLSDYYSVFSKHVQICWVRVLILHISYKVSCDA